MNKRSVLMMIFAMASTIAFAQHDVEKAKVERFSEYMKTELSLTDDQYVKVKTIDQEFFGQLKSTRKDSASRTAIKKIREDRVAALKNVLTEKQFAQWMALKANHQGKRNGKQIRDDYMKKE